MSPTTIRLLSAGTITMVSVQCCAGMFVVSIDPTTALADFVLLCMTLLALGWIDQAERHRCWYKLGLIGCAWATLYIGVASKWTMLHGVMSHDELRALTPAFRCLLDALDMFVAVLLMLLYRATGTLVDAYPFVKREDRPRTHRVSPFE